MYRDVDAAIAFLQREKGCDPTRIGLVGASVGCSVAVDATVRNAHAVRAVVLLTPGSKYLGVNTLKHLRRWPGTRTFTFVSSEEEKRSAEVMKALDAFEGSNRMVVSGSGIHGTRMFGKVPSIEELIANFMASSLKGTADLRVPVWPKDSAEPSSPGFFRKTLRPRRTVKGITYSLMLYGVGEEWTIGAAVEGDFKGKVFFTVGKEPIELPFDTKGRGGKITAGAVEAHQASAGKFHWVLFARKRLEKYTKLSLEFRASSGKRVRLPSKGEFAAAAVPVGR